MNKINLNIDKCIHDKFEIESYDQPLRINCYHRLNLVNVGRRDTIYLPLEVMKVLWCFNGIME